MTILYSTNFDSFGNEVPTGFVGDWRSWDVTGTGLNISGTNIYTMLGGTSWGKCTAPGAQTEAEYYGELKAVFNGASLAFPHLGHGNTTDLWGNFNYRILMSGTATGFAASLAPYIEGSFIGQQAAGTHTVAIAANDILKFRLKIVGQVVQLWVWNSTVESEPATPITSWTDSTQRAAGYFTVLTQDGGILYGIDNLSISDVASGATAVTLSGPSGGIVGVASSSFTAGANGAITGTVTVTPSDSAGGGTFSPTTVNISSSTPTAVFTYTPGSAGAKSITVTNNGSLSNPSAHTYTATAVTVIPVDDASLFWSPYSWDALGIGDFSVATKSKQTALSGSYLKFKATGTTVIKLGIDSSMYTGLTAIDLPILSWSVNNGTVQSVQLGLATSEVTLASGLTTGTTYPVQVWVKGFTNSLGDRWGSAGVSPTNIVRINGIRLDSGGSVSAPDGLQSNYSIIYGDSIGEGHRSLRNTQINANGMGKSFAWYIGQGLGTEYTVCGFSGQDWDGADSVNARWNYHSSGRSRDFSTPPKFVFAVFGSNNSNSPTGVASWLTAARAALGAGVHLFACVATTGIGAASVVDGVANYLSANPTDLRSHLIDVRDTTPLQGSFFYGEDALHSDENAQAIWASAVIAAASQIIALEKPTATKTVTINLVNASNVAQTGLSGLKWAWFDQNQPQSFMQPTDSGAAETTDGSGVLTITIHTNLSSGSVGWLDVTNSDGNPATAHKAFSGPVVVS